MRLLFQCANEAIGKDGKNGIANSIFFFKLDLFYEVLEKQAIAY